VVDEVYDEKRSFVRMTVDTLVSLTLRGKGDTAYHGASQNLSATGLPMTTETGMTIGDGVELIMNPSDNKSPPFLWLKALLFVLSLMKPTLIFTLSLFH
jgi:hypothetical protein